MNNMDNTVKCIILGEDLPALPFSPVPGELGKRIQQSVSQKAWQDWLAHQTMLINEMRLSMGNAEHRKYLTDQMEKYFFGGKVDKPSGYVPPG